MLSSANQVVWALITYTDWWQPSTSSVYRIGNRRESVRVGRDPRRACWTRSRSATSCAGGCS